MLVANFHRSKEAVFWKEAYEIPGFKKGNI